MGLHSVSCSLDTDCNKGSCKNSSCTCVDGFVGKNCEFSNPCTDSLCQNGGQCISVDSDGSYYCDCKTGYIEPHCEEQNPCVLEGTAACLNGSTCKRVNSFDFECKCRLPYVGEFCETFNLCEIDIDECIEDLHVQNPDDPFCHPCIAEANCSQVALNEYVCVCQEGINHTSCHASDNFLTAKARNYLQIQSPLYNDNANPPQEHWNPIIPSIAITCCGLYFIILIIVLILGRRRAKQHSKFIVCCDIHEYDVLTYYLISVETGKQWNAGTETCTVYCWLHGENGRAGPYPLNDRNLKGVYVLQRAQEDHYLVSCSNELGKIVKLTISFDDKNTNDSWFCSKVTILNLKTNENWLFYASTWIQTASSSSKIHELIAASPENIKKQNQISYNCQHIQHQSILHHSYISPIIFITPEKVTLAFAELMTYMLLLIALYGFLTVPDPDFVNEPDYSVGHNVLANGSIAAICSFILSLLYSILFIIRNTKRIPTLIVWHNRPGMPETLEYDLEESLVDNSITEKKVPPASMHSLPTGNYADAQTNTDNNDNFQATTQLLKPKERKTRGVKRVNSAHGGVFRIPSTDIIRTEDWIYEVAEGSSGPDKLTKVDLVQRYMSEEELQAIPQKLADYGFIGSLRGIREQDPESFVYKINSTEDTNLEHAIEQDLKDLHGVLMYPPKNVSSSISLQPSISHETTVTQLSDLESNTNLTNAANSAALLQDAVVVQLPSIIRSKSAIGTPTMAAGDFIYPKTNDQGTNTIACKKHVPVWCELCKMDYYQFGEVFTGSCVGIGWIVCVGVILSSTIVCCIYGGKYGYCRTYDWCVSLIICWIESFLVYQFVKILIIVAVRNMLNKKGLLPNAEDKRVKERFQVYYLEGLSAVHKRYPLKFVQYFPKDWNNKDLQLHEKTGQNVA